MRLPLFPLLLLRSLDSTVVRNPYLPIHHLLQIINNELIFDANELFKGYIYSRVSSVNSHQNVSEDQFGVYLKAQDFKICIVGRFERFTRQILDRKDDSYSKFKADFGPLRECDALYFAYPRQEGLKKFINFDTYTLNSQKSVKIVPYLVTNQFLRRKQCQ
mgnify:CR=1 FL=1